MEQTTEQETELGQKVRAFWNGLSPEEQARLDGALRRLVDEGGDVSGHGLTEYALVVQLIALAGTVIHL
jgi:hypothetical protein